MVWKLPYVKVRTVLKSTDSQLSYEHKKKVISCRNCWENCNWSVSIKIRFCYCNVTVTFSLLSRFLAYLGQFESISHIQGHPWKAENYSFLLTPSLITPLLNGPLAKNRDQRSGILHIARDPLSSPKMLLVRSESWILRRKSPFIDLWKNAKPNPAADKIFGLWVKFWPIFKKSLSKSVH